MKELLFFSLILLFLNPSAFGQINQESEDEIDSIIEELMYSDSETLLEYIDELNKYQVLYASLGFNNKTYFLGRDLGIDQYSLTPQLFYQHSNGIFVGVSGTVYSEFDPQWDLTTLTGGYGNYFGKHKNFSYELSYSRYIFSDSESNDFENSFEGSFSVETKDNSFGVSTNLAYFFGKEQGFQTSFDVYSEIDLFKINDNTKVTFSPLLTFQLGSETIDTSRIEDLLDEIPPFIVRVVNSFEEFNLRNTQLQLPITLETGNFYFETGYNFNFPNALDFERNLENSSFLSLRLSYIIDLN